MSEERYGSLDTLRGLAALIVAIWHYQMLSPATLPLANSIAFLHKMGWVFVDFFFCLSGFIFFQKYYLRINSGKIAINKFIWLRITRLYPLHLATLLLCVVMYVVSLLPWLEPLPIHNPNLFYFILNVFFIQFGWLTNQQSFNAVAWSASIEMGLYIVFFLVALLPRKYVIFTCAAVTLIGVVLLKAVVDTPWPFISFWFGRGLSAFFIGALCAICYNVAHRSGYARILGNVMVAVFCVSAVVCVLATLGRPWAILLAGSENPGVPILQLDFILVVFPAAILASVLNIRLRNVLSHRYLTFLGDISYSLYLLHYLVLMLIDELSWHMTLALSTWTMFGCYLLAIIGAATLCHYRFEMPAMYWLRHKFRFSRDMAAFPPERDAKVLEVHGV